MTDTILTPPTLNGLSPPVVGGSASRTITITLNRQSAFVGFAVLLLLVVAIETTQLVRLRSAIAAGGTSVAPTAAPAAPGSLDALPDMSGGC